MSRHHSNEARGEKGWSLTDVEVFYAGRGDLPADDDGTLSDAGWYFRFGFAGCIPESSPFGPYTSEAAAIAAMREVCDD